MSYPTTPAEIADELQAIVDDLRAMPDNTELAPTAVSVTFQPVPFRGTPEQRMQSVDLLAWALTGWTGELVGSAYRTGHRQHAGGAEVSVFTDSRPEGVQ